MAASHANTKRKGAETVFIALNSFAEFVFLWSHQSFPCVTFYSRRSLKLLSSRTGVGVRLCPFNLMVFLVSRLIFMLLACSVLSL